MIAGNMVFHKPRSNCCAWLQAMWYSTGLGRMWSPISRAWASLSLTAKLFRTSCKKSLPRRISRSAIRQSPHRQTAVSCYNMTNALCLTLHQWTNQVADVRDTCLQVRKYTCAIRHQQAITSATWPQARPQRTDMVPSLSRHGVRQGTETANPSHVQIDICAKPAFCEKQDILEPKAAGGKRL